MTCKSLFLPILLFLFLTKSSLAIVFVNQPTSFNAFCNECAHNFLGIPSTTAPTVKASVYELTTTVVLIYWFSDIRSRIHHTERIPTCWLGNGWQRERVYWYRRLEVIADLCRLILAFSQRLPQEISRSGSDWSFGLQNPVFLCFGVRLLLG